MLIRYLRAKLRKKRETCYCFAFFYPIFMIVQKWLSSCPGSSRKYSERNSRYSERNSRYSRAAREPAEAVFHSRGPPANPPKRFFSLAGLPRARRSGFSPLQAACEPAEAFFLSREMEATPQQCGGRSPRETQGVCPRVFILVRGSWRLCGRLSRRPCAPFRRLWLPSWQPSQRPWPPSWRLSRRPSRHRGRLSRRPSAP